MEEGLARPDLEMWKGAMAEELKSFEENSAITKKGIDSLLCP